MSLNIIINFIPKKYEWEKVENFILWWTLKLILLLKSVKTERVIPNLLWGCIKFDIISNMGRRWKRKLADARVYNNVLGLIYKISAISSDLE